MDVYARSWAPIMAAYDTYVVHDWQHHSSLSWPSAGADHSALPDALEQKGEPGAVDEPSVDEHESLKLWSSPKRPNDRIQDDKMPCLGEGRCRAKIPERGVDASAQWGEWRARVRASERPSMQEHRAVLRQRARRVYASNVRSVPSC